VEGLQDIVARHGKTVVRGNALVESAIEAVATATLFALNATAAGGKKGRGSLVSGALCFDCSDSPCAVAADNPTSRLFNVFSQVAKWFGRPMNWNGLLRWMIWETNAGYGALG
jgi:hypothetical protein